MAVPTNSQPHTGEPDMSELNGTALIEELRALRSAVEALTATLITRDEQATTSYALEPAEMSAVSMIDDRAIRLAGALAVAVNPTFATGCEDMRDAARRFGIFIKAITDDEAGLSLRP